MPSKGVRPESLAQAQNVRLSSRQTFRFICSFSMRLAVQSIRSFFSTSRSPIMSASKQLSEQEWQVKLTPAQFKVLREKGTERAGTGALHPLLP
jgi:hypothetical protein